MNKAFAFVRGKLSVKVSLWVVFFAAIIFNIALGWFFYQARDAVRSEAVSRATQILDKTSLRVEGILNRVEVASNMTKWLVLRHPNKADSMFVYSRGMLENNPDFYNTSIAFEPYHFKERGRYFSAYTRHIGDSIRTTQGGSESYQRDGHQLLSEYQGRGGQGDWRHQYQPLAQLALADHLRREALSQLL